MAGTPLEIAQQRLQAYLDTEMAILTAGQEGSFATRRRREAELVEVRKGIAELQAEIAGLQGGGSRLLQVVIQ